MRTETLVRWAETAIEPLAEALGQLDDRLICQQEHYISQAIIKSATSGAPQHVKFDLLAQRRVDFVIEIVRQFAPDLIAINLELLQPAISEDKTPRNKMLGMEKSDTLAAESNLTIMWLQKRPFEALCL